MIIQDFGIMQGRLLPKYKGRFQAHPLGYWKDEFDIAKHLGLKYIEFILDFNDYNLNPLMSDKGIYEIKDTIQKTGVGVRSICADFFMEAPLHSENEIISIKSSEILIKLIKNASLLGVTDIVIPCVDQSSLNNEFAQKRLIKNLQKSIEFASTYGINLSLETDLAPIPFLNLLEQFKSNVIKVNYDLGNSASLGYDIQEEFRLYGNRISDIHIKDRNFGGGSVILGNGNVNFNLFFEILSNHNFTGPVIMQVYRDDEGIEVFKKQFNWLKTKLKNKYDSDYSS